MTVYYVDPVNGSNSNNGLSWGTAWLWASGHGVTILPGDELRFAETIKRTTTNTYLPALAGTITPTAPSAAASWVIPSAGWVKGSTMPAQVTATTAGVSFATSAVVGASSKIAYAPVASSPDTTAKSSMHIMVEFPTDVSTSNYGTRFAIKLCSDAIGDVPVATLNFGTYVPVAGGVCIAIATVDTGSATPLNLGTIGSIAFYSIGSYSCAAGTKYLRLVTPYFAFLNASKTSTEYIAPRSAFKAGPLQTRNGIAVPVIQTYGVLDYIDSTPIRVSGTQRIPLTQLGTTQSTAAVLETYPPLPFTTKDKYAFPLLAFAGTSGSPITLSGGWNTTTGLQTGYTCLNSEIHTNAYPGFSFSSTPNNLVVSRFIATDSVIIMATQASSPTIESLTFTDCHAAGMYGVRLATYAVTIGNMLCTRCQSSASNGGLVVTAAGVVGQRNAHTTITGEMVWVDSIVGHSRDNVYQQYTNLPNAASKWKIMSSSSTLLQSVMYHSGSNNDSSFVCAAGTSIGEVSFLNTTFDSAIYTISGTGDGTLARQCNLVVDGIAFYTQMPVTLTIDYWKTTYIGKVYVNASPTSIRTMMINSVGTLATMPAMRPSCTLAGPVVVDGPAGFAYEFRIDNMYDIDVLPTAHQVGASAPYPRLTLYSFLRCTVQPGLWSYLYVAVNDNGSPKKYTIGAEEGWFKAIGVTCLFDNSHGVGGDTILIGCTLRGGVSDTTSPWYGSTITSQKSSVLGSYMYGCTLDPTMGTSLAPVETYAGTVESGFESRMFQLHGNTMINAYAGFGGGSIYVQYASDYTGTTNPSTQNSVPTAAMYEFSDTSFVQQTGTGGGTLRTTGVIRPDGFPELTLSGVVHFATVYGVPGKPITLSVVVYSSYTALTLVVPPCPHYLGDISEHVMVRSISGASYTYGLAVSFTINPQQAGPLDLYLCCSSVNIYSATITQ